MGCHPSSLAAVGAGGAKGKELSDYLTPQEKEIVRRNWDAMQQDGISEGVFLFDRMFAQQDDFKRIFKAMMTVSDSGEHQVDWGKVRIHAAKVMETLDKVVKHLQDSSQLTPELMQLGKKHMEFYAKPDMPTLMWPALRDTLKHSLASDFLVDAELAWKHLFDYITDKMHQGSVDFFVYSLQESANPAQPIDRKRGDTLQSIPRARLPSVSADLLDTPGPKGGLRIPPTIGLSKMGVTAHPSQCCGSTS